MEETDRDLINNRSSSYESSDTHAQRRTPTHRCIHTRMSGRLESVDGDCKVCVGVRSLVFGALAGVCVRM